MQMYEVTALSEDMQTEILKKILFAEDEDDAIDRMNAILAEENLTCDFCVAEEI